MTGALAVVLAGCGGTKTTTPGSGGSTGDTNPNATGNWQFTLTSTSGSALPAFSGYLRENITDTTASKVTAAELTETATSSCFRGTNALSFDGSIDGTAVALYSFSLNGQFITFNATLNSTSTAMTGTYSVSDGCANGAAGTLSGTYYDPLSGTYAGSIAGTSGAETISTTLTQETYGNGNGDILVNGTATFGGISCFTTGTTISPLSFVTGSTVVLTFSTNDTSGATATVTGTFDPTADTITATSVNVSSGSCAGNLGTATLTN